MARLVRLGSLAALAAVALLAVGAAGGFTAGNTVPATNLGRQITAITASSVKPAACTGTVTRVLYVPSGGSLYTVNTSGNLILGTSGNDRVFISVNGYNCFVGGGPTSSNTDAFSGPTSGGDQCIVATSDSSSNITHCTIVQRRP